MTRALTPADFATRLRQLMSDAVGLRPEDKESVVSVIEGGEWLIAVEILCTQFYEWEISLTSRHIRELEELGSTIGASHRFTDLLWEITTDS